MSRKYAVFQDDGQLSQRLDSALHQIPTGALELDEETWLRLTQETDGIWYRRAGGKLVKEPLPGGLPDWEIAQIQERSWRDEEVIAVAWLRDRHRDEVELEVPTTLTGEQFVELLGYLQALRQWPQSSEFPAQTVRPAQPDWLAELRS